MTFSCQFNQTIPTEHSPNFDSIHKILEEYKAASALSHFPPFSGGAVGYVSYDAIKSIESIPITSNGMGAEDIHMMLFKNIIAFDRLKHRVYLVSYLFVENNDACSLENLYESCQKCLADISSRLFKPLEKEAIQCNLEDYKDLLPVDAKALLGQENFIRGVKKIKNHIRQGDIFQGVLSERFEFDFSGDPFLVYRVLKMINPSPYLFFLSLGKDEYLLGASPEMLVQVIDGHLATCPIAGTRPRGKDLKSDHKMEMELLSSKKERAEHIMLVDLGRNDIGRVAKPGSVRVTRFMEVERYSHVMHMVSLVEGKLKKHLSPWKAFTSCFPAGTLSGAPKIRAMQILSEIEPKGRGPYGGAVVCYDFRGHLNSCITIRSLYLNKGKAYIQAGAGVVADSKPIKEYEEVLNKAKAIRTAVAMALKIEEGPNDSTDR